jgi:hypothetical protein
MLPTRNAIRLGVRHRSRLTNLLLLLVLGISPGCGGPSPAPSSVATSTESTNAASRSGDEKSTAAPAIDAVTSSTPAQGEPGSPAVAAPERKSETAQVQTTQPLYRASDPPPRHDDTRLAQLGILKYASKRLQLYTDIKPELARPLPELMDRAYDVMVEYFGPLPPDREGTEFVMTGYLMADKARFREAGLLTEDVPPFPHGRNMGTRFYMNDQPTDYYRRHLMLHEGTHCFMTAVQYPLRRRVWYMEGMAELFGTHRFDAGGRPYFGVMPHDRGQFANLGRIRLVEDEVREHPPRELSAVMELRPNDFLANPAYAWSWALCKFLDGHPRYHDQFRRMSHAATTGERTADWNTLFTTNRADLEEEWLLFGAGLCLGYDLARAAIEFRSGEPLRADRPASVEIAADRGWQSSGVAVEGGKTYQVTASGRFVIANANRPASPSGPAAAPSAEPKKESDRPWESEPQGISFRYHAGRPLGMLLGTIRAAVQPTQPPRTTMLEVIPIGREVKFTAPVSGTLYLRVNDFWNELEDNSGRVGVQIREVRGRDAS